VGGVTIGSSTAITAVYSGPNEIFIGSSEKVQFFSIPWHRIDSISDSNGKRLTLLVNRPKGNPTHIEIPWSDNMTLDGWERHNYMSE
jgi:cytolysin (calcineurin-like family phosphatase)